ncbi:hypothetical protein [Actinoplanes sp. NPDC051494]|uniref:hypothetical protein n=1 Tax=Actinoplanes sp. NPDC051494 TaxID=3363907 RepID=UPI00379B43F0
MTDPELAAAFAAHKRAEKSLETKRVELFKTIGEAVLSGRVRQGEVVKQLGFTREHVRRICESYVKWQSGENPDFRIIREPKTKQSA